MQGDSRSKFCSGDILDFEDVLRSRFINDKAPVTLPSAIGRKWANGNDVVCGWASAKGINESAKVHLNPLSL
jgi:hypothetical protein